ncbi:hypothetical protein [Burkholderia sp. TSV86]|uniref:hypothetical protein n=1 Tax=Burkholderia sp. TSV86 TaxID=1385594 RepID=UPI00075D431E|nr:hypothetical protein [Burkholderia sp. TSV86]KVE39767.1 hypothetical protein WS68_19280 [Burkholderia sp. TSV86]
MRFIRFARRAIARPTFWCARSVARVGRLVAAAYVAPRLPGQTADVYPDVFVNDDAAKIAQFN